MEYAIIIGVVVAALSAMQVYIKRGIQATIKVAADEVGRQEEAEDLDPEKGTQTTSRIDTFTQKMSRIRLLKGGSQTIDPNSISTSSGETTYKHISEK